MKRLYSLFPLIICLLLITSCKKKENKFFSCIDDLNGRTVAVLVGSTHDKYVTKHFPNSKILRVNDDTELLLDLEKGQCDFIVMDGTTANIATKGKHQYSYISEKLFEEPMGIGFFKGNTDIRDSFNIFLKKIKENGLYEKLTDKWFNHSDTATLPVLKTPTEGEALKVGVLGTIPPFSFIKNNELIGFDVELMNRFSIAINRPITYVQIPFSSLITSVSTGNINIATGGITITEERTKQIDFSDVYYNSYATVLCLTKNYKQSSSNVIYYNINDIRKSKIGVLTGSSQDMFATRKFPKAKIQRIDIQPDLIMSLTSHKSDAIIYDGITAKYVLKHNNGLAILDGNISNTKYYVCFQKNDNKYHAKFNEFLKEINSNGIYNEMYDRWINNTETSEIPNINNSCKNGTIRIGTTGETPVFSFIKNNKPTGFDIELMTRFAAYLQMKPEFVLLNFESLLNAAISKQVDVIANSIMFTSERAKQLAFSNSYFEAQTAVIVNKYNLPDAFTNRKDINNASIGVMTGSIGEMYVKEKLTGAKAFCFDNIMDAIAALNANKIDYVLTAYTTAHIAASKNDNLICLPEKYIQEGARIAINKNNTELLNEINNKLQEYKDNGILEEIINHWINVDPEKGYEIPNISINNHGKVLRVGVAANREPMIFISNNKIQGLDSELIQRLAYDLGYRVEFSDMNFSALIAALTTNKVDAVISNMSTTEERKKVVNFSDIYYTNPQIMLCTKSNKVIADTELKTSTWEKTKESFYNNLVLEKRYKLILDGLKETVIIAIFSILLGTLLGAIICYLRMRRSKLAIGFAKVYIDIIRGVPVLVLLMIMFYVIFSSTGISATLVAIITFAINFSAYVSEMFRTSIEGVDKGQSEAGVALGFTKTKTFIYIIMPQAIKTVLPVFKGESISLIKMTSVVGYIAIQDLTKASDIIRSRTFDAFFPLIVISIIYFILAWLLGLFLDYLGKRQNKTT